MTVKKLIEKIEGEAELDFTFRDGKIEDVKIGFGFYRGIEEILVGKAPRDALVITPRVCGICNHAHLIAAVRAIEKGYANAGIDVVLSEKAEKIREFTLACELIQNHLKWFYMTVIPRLEKLIGEESGENHALKASYLSTTITKALAIFAGQWPHASYAIPGGVTCDPTYVDIMQAQSLVDESIRFFEQMVTGMDLQQYLEIESVSALSEVSGDLGRVLYQIGRHQMAKKGQSHDRFIVFGAGMGFTPGKSIVTSVSKVDLRYVEESPQKGTTAKAVTYKKRQYEVGPLARGMVNKRAIIKSLHKRYKDSLLTRLFARMYEAALLLQYARKTLAALDVREPSCTLGDRLLCGEFTGTGIVEAARGSLIHRIDVRERRISHYEIIVPTQWNLSQGSGEEQGVAVKAMTGSESTEEAVFIFRTFDVCSVCTTQ
jgi:Ni,Fe-hydrogenase I large subunit